MGSLLGHDFSRVRVHRDAAADRAARSVDAVAYTFGSELVFAAGEYRPETDEGWRLLAHELTHVVQQSHSLTGGAAPGLPPPDSPLEREADAVAASLGSPAARRPTLFGPLTVARQRRRPAARHTPPAPPPLATNTGGGVATAPGQTVQLSPGATEVRRIIARASEAERQAIARALDAVAAPGPGQELVQVVMPPPSEDVIAIRPSEAPLLACDANPRRCSTPAPPPPARIEARPDGSLRMSGAHGPDSEWDALHEFRERTPALSGMFIGGLRHSTLDYADESYPVYVVGAGAAAAAAVSQVLGEGVFVLAPVPGERDLAAPGRVSWYRVSRVNARGTMSDTGQRLRVSGLGPSSRSMLVYVSDTSVMGQAINVTARPPDSPELRAERDRFVAQFGPRALASARQLLRESAARLNDQLERYGITVERRTVRAPSGEGVPQVVGYHMRATTGSVDLQRVARETIFRRIELSRMRHQRSFHASSPEGAEAVARLPSAEADYRRFRRTSEREHTVLQSFPEWSARYETLAAGPSDEMAAMVGGELQNSLNQIEWLQSDLNEQRVWMLPRVLERTRREMNIAPGSVQARWVEDHARAVTEDHDFTQRAVGVVAFALGIVAAAVTLGGASPAVVAGVTGASAAASVAGAAQSADDYQFQSAALHTDVDRARTLMEGEDPSLLWLMLEVVGAITDARAATEAFRTLAPLVRRIFTDARAGRAVTQAIEELRATGNGLRDAAGAERRLGDRVADATTVRAPTPTAPAASVARAAGQAAERTAGETAETAARGGADVSAPTTMGRVADPPGTMLGIPATLRGLAATGAQTQFMNAIRQLRQVWANLPIEERVNRLIRAINEQLIAQGLPAIRFDVNAAPPPGVPGQFDRTRWQVLLRPSQVLFAQTPAEVNEIAELLYHEARHSEQWFLIVRLRAGMGENAAAIAQQLGQIDAETVEFALRNPLQITDPQYSVAVSLWDSIYNSGFHARNQVMEELRRTGPLRAEATAAYLAVWDNSGIPYARRHALYVQFQQADNAYQQAMRQYRLLPVEIDAYGVSDPIRIGLGNTVLPWEQVPVPPPLP